MLISIHAPCEGGDVGVGGRAVAVEVISIHAPCEGGDKPPKIYRFLLSRFQSTPPARGATWRPSPVAFYT